jgi:hypothetical protein
MLSLRPPGTRPARMSFGDILKENESMAYEEIRPELESHPTVYVQQVKELYATRQYKLCLSTALRLAIWLEIESSKEVSGIYNRSDPHRVH